jgi:DNA-nicking Smr family endonuclease
VKGGKHSLNDLGGLKKALQKAEREAAEEKARLAAEEARMRQERDLFANSVGTVQRLHAAPRAQPAKPRPEPVPQQRQRDEEAVLKETISDDFNVDSLLETDDTLSYRREDIGLDVVRKLRRGGWTLQAEIDLHGLRRDEARERLAEFLRDAVGRGLRCVRVVHGKGLGSAGREPVLKPRVHSWLVQKKEVIAFVQARAAEGGSGALLVLLRPN